MNLGDLMNQLADDVDTTGLADPGAIRGRGDQLRTRSRTRYVVAAVAAVVIAVAAGMAITQRSTTSAPQPVGPVDGWWLTRTLEVPGNGTVIYADGSLWVTDNKSQETGPDGTPTGVLYQVDPETGEVLARLPGAVGGWPSVGAGAIWVSNVLQEELTRIDLASHEVTAIAIHRPKQHPQGSAVADGNLWVINNSAGDLLRLDSRSYRVAQRIHLGTADQGKAPRSIITDGHSIWVSDDNGLVLRFDGTTGEQVSRLQLPIRQVLFDGIDPGRHTLYAHQLRGNTILEIDTDQAGTEWDGRELQLTDSVDGMGSGLAMTSGAWWATTSNPDELLRIDPDTFEVAARTPLRGINHESNVPVALASGAGAVWIRIQDKVLELRPDR